MNAEIITIGDELLLGQVVDTNSAWMGLKLAEAGVHVSRRTAVGDNKTDILKAIDEAKSRVNLVLITGGLGPTRDDITKNTLAEFFNCGFRTDQQVLAFLESLFAKRGRKMLEVNRMQAELPEACTTLLNEVGTAPGMLFDTEKLVLISMPGVPIEMKHIMEKRVLPWLPTRFVVPTIYHKTLLTSGIPESLLADRLTDFEDQLPDGLKLAYLPAFNSIRLRLTGNGPNKAEVIQMVDSAFSDLEARCGEFVVTSQDIPIASFIAQSLISSNKSIALAESCTGGFIANQLILEPGISAVMKGAMITYSNEIKHQELGVPLDIFTTVGAVSEECARAMVEGIRKKFDSDLAISTTGIAGPGGATPEKPVGLIYIGIATRNETIVKSFHLFGSREVFMQRACTAALDLLRNYI